MIHGLALVCVWAIAGGETMPPNPVFKELTASGVATGDGKAYPLPAPSMGKQRTAKSQRAAIEKVGQGRFGFDDLTRKLTTAPFAWNIRTLRPPKEGQSAVRAVDVWFVAHGKWETLQSQDFLDSLAKKKGTQQSDKEVLKSGYLTEGEMKKRHLEAESTPQREVKYVYTTFALFDQVRLSATRLAVVTRSDSTVLAAAKMDPRFAEDPEYPNQWRLIHRDANADIYYGPPHPYTGAGVYVKVTRLIKPAGAIFVEGHLVFEEPYGWFEGGNMLRSKLPAILRTRVRRFRRQFAIVSKKQEQTLEKTPEKDSSTEPSQEKTP